MDAGTCAIYLTHSASGILVRLGNGHSWNDQTQSQQRHNVRPAAINLHGDLPPGQPFAPSRVPGTCRNLFYVCDTAARDILGKLSANRKLSESPTGRQSSQLTQNR